TARPLRRPRRLLPRRADRDPQPRRALPRRGRPMNNRAAVMPELGRIELQDRPAPAPSGREVVVRVEAVGVCGSDTAYFTVGSIGDWIVDGPIILGHEGAGQVHALGPGG